MRGMTSGVAHAAAFGAILGLLTSLAFAVSALPAAACEVDATGICLDGTEPGAPPGGPTDPADTSGSSGSDIPVGDPACRDQSGAPVPCVDGYGGSWSGAPRWCYQYRLDPQPPPGSALWGQHDPEGGSLWSCDYSVAVPGNTWFVPDGVALVDAGAIARDLLSRTDFEYAEAVTAPGDGSPTYVGYRTWLWVPETQWRAVSASLTVSGATVTIQGVPVEVDWKVGPHGLACPGPGTAWSPDMDEDAHTSCSIEIDDLTDPDGDSLRVTARIRYAVTWTCVGRCSAASGDLGNVSALPGAPAELLVRQRQTVVTS
ncbi:hypothetical protein [Nocardioides dongkuii]|uniref:hypothetical protein n=1 Tax=Nocardioides dongkuii TaxID=2760089 RepID=UPI0018783337|nr:hypothetical protein [Nocardioides dongkuii]